MTLQRLKLFIIDNQTQESKVIEFDSYGDLRAYAQGHKETLLEKIEEAVLPNKEEQLSPTTGKQNTTKKTSMSKKSSSSKKKFLQNELRDEVQDKNKKRPSMKSRPSLKKSKK